jgi:hypothetical protein
MNPSIFIAKGTPAKKCKEDNVRGAALCVLNASPHRGFVRSLQNEYCELLPVRRQHAAIRDWKSGAKGLGNERSIVSWGVGHFDVLERPIT